MKAKKVTALALCATMALSMAACGGSSAPAETQAAGGETQAAAAATGDGTSITVFNSKSEIQDKMVEMAAKYSQEKGVNVEVYYSSDTVAAHMASKYASKQPYTIAMVDAKDVYSLGADHAADLSDQEWVANTNGAISIDGKVVGFPVCVEARGLMYNAEAIEAITGEEFVPENYKTLDAFKGLIETLKAGGMETPVAIMKEDWSLAAHFLAMVYEEQDDVDAVIASLHAGEFDLAADKRFNDLFDTWEVLRENNIAKAAPVAAVREDLEMNLAEGDVAFMFGGNWDWSLIADFADNGTDSKLGMMGVPQNDDTYNDVLVGGPSKYFFIDNTVSEAEAQAAKDFLNWLVFDAEGNAFITEECALVPAFSNIDASALDPLSKSVKAYVDAGKTVPSYNYAPDDHYAKLGAVMQKYLAGEIDRAGFAEEVKAYWTATTPVEH